MIFKMPGRRMAGSAVSLALTRKLLELRYELFKCGNDVLAGQDI
jgi:hypothetical protein